MPARIRTFLDKMANNKILQKVFFYLICALTLLYVFTIPSFSARERVYIIAYFAMALLLGASILYIIIFRNYKFDKRTLMLPLFVIFAFFGTLFFSHAFRDYLTLILLAVTFYTLLVAFSIINDSRLALQIVTFALLAFSIYYIVVYRHDILNASKFTGESFRLGWYFDNPNAIGTFMNIGISISLYLALFGKNKWYYLFLLATFVFFLVGFTTGSRTFILSSILSVVLLLFFRFKQHWLVFLLILVALIVVFIALLNTPLMVTVKYRIQDTLDIFTGGGSGGGTAGSTTERLLWQQYGLYFGSRHLIFGYGTNGFAVFSGTHTYTHGNFSEVLCDFGLPGFILFYSVFLIPAIILTLSHKKEKFFVLTTTAVFLLEGFLSVYYYSKVTYVLLAINFFAIKDLTFKDVLALHNFTWTWVRKKKVIDYDFYQVNI